jgi:hypothetical protein
MFLSENCLQAWSHFSGVAENKLKISDSLAGLLVLGSYLAPVLRRHRYAETLLSVFPQKRKKNGC